MGDMEEFIDLVKWAVGEPAKDFRPAFPDFTLTSDIQNNLFKIKGLLELSDLGGAIDLLQSTAGHFMAKVTHYCRNCVKRGIERDMEELLRRGCDRSTMSSLRSAINDFFSYAGQKDMDIRRASRLCWETLAMIDNAFANLESQRAQQAAEEQRRLKDACQQAATQFSAMLGEIGIESASSPAAATVATSQAA